jgi:chitodextrinase
MRRNYSYSFLLVLLAFLVPDIRAQQLVANYTFDGKAGDASVYANNAQVHGANLTQDRFGVANHAFWFDGIQSYITAPNAAQLQSPTTSVSFWVRVDELPAQGEVFLLSNGGWQERWKISLPSHGKPVWTTNHVGGISDMDSGDGHALVVGAWTHLVMVHDGTKDYIYINGAEAAQKDVPGDLNITTYPLGIGYNPVDGGGYFKGAIDEVEIFDAALDASQVASLYAAQNTAPAFGTDLVADYALNGNGQDASIYGNTAKANDVTFVPDRFGFGRSAASFNGTSSELTAANSAPLNGATTTVSFWIKANTLPANGETFIASFGGWQQRWKISLPSHGKMVWTTNHVGGISDMDAGGGHELVPGQWVHAAFVHDGVKDYIYINGLEVAQKDVAGDLNDTQYPLGIGYNPVDGGNYFDGSIDKFQIYNYALSAGDITNLFLSQSNGGVDPNDILLASYPFAGDNTDKSQYKNDALSEGATFTTDRFGYANNAIHLDGTADLEVLNSSAYNTPWTTVSFWVNMDELPANGEVYLMSFGGWQERWKISLPSHGKPVWTTNHVGGISDMDSGDGHALVPGQWTHVVCTHGMVNDEIYINGTLANSKAVGGAMNSTTHDFGMGYNAVDGGNYMKGSIDEVQMYNHPFSAFEVQNLYNAQNTPPVFTSNVAADYKLDGNTNDDSDYRNNATNRGATSGKNRFGQANHDIVFDGVSAEVEAANSVQLNSPLTSVSFWVNVNNLPGNGEAYLMSFGGWQERWKISLPAHGKPVWTTNHVGGISDMDAGDGHALVPGEWTHLVFVHDGAKDIIYENGQPVATKDVPGILNSTTHVLGIGYNAVDGGNWFDGSLDDILIFNTALTAQEVLDLYDAQSADPGLTDVTAPSAPLDLTSDVSFTNVGLSWQASMDMESGVAGYNVYQNGKNVATTSDLNASFSGLLPLTSYEFGVSAVDSAGNESTITTLTVVTGMDQNPDTEAPSAPANLHVTAGSNSVVFSWDPSTDNTAVVGYVVTVDGNLVDTVYTPTTSIFIGGLDPSTLYTFEVYAFDPSGNNSDISDITESTTAPIDTGEPGLVAWYKFEGDAKDATPYHNDGAIGGNPTFEPVTNRPNASGMNIVFDGDQDSVLCPNAVQLISDYATVGFWIRLDGQNLNDAESYIIDFGHWDERWKISLPQHRQIVWTTNGNNAQFDHFISDMDAGAGNDLVQGFWFYVTMVHDGTNDIIYLDGQQVNSKPVASKLNSTDNPLGMGSNPVDGRQYFHGALDEVKIYNKALTSAEIDQLYTTGVTAIGEVPNEVRKFVDVIYPNPTADQLLIKHGFNTTQDLLIRIFDTAGREISSSKIDAKDMVNGQIRLNVANINTGMYNLNFVLGGKNLGSIPFVKQ